MNIDERAFDSVIQEMTDRPHPHDWRRLARMAIELYEAALSPSRKDLLAVQAAVNDLGLVTQGEIVIFSWRADGDVSCWRCANTEVGRHKEIERIKRAISRLNFCLGVPEAKELGKTFAEDQS